MKQEKREKSSRTLSEALAFLRSAERQEVGIDALLLSDFAPELLTISESLLEASDLHEANVKSVCPTCKALGELLESMAYVR